MAGRGVDGDRAGDQVVGPHGTGLARNRNVERDDRTATVAAAVEIGGGDPVSAGINAGDIVRGPKRGSELPAGIGRVGTVFPPGGQGMGPVDVDGSTVQKLLIGERGQCRHGGGHAAKEQARDRPMHAPIIGTGG